MSIRDFNRAAIEAKNKSRGTGNRFPPREMQEVSFDKDETFLFRFLPTDRAFIWWRHWPAGGAPHSCTLEMQDFDGKCVFCHYFPKKDDQGRRQQQVVMEGIDFRFLHIVPSEKDPERDTMVRCAHQDPVPPARNRCTHCNSSDPKERERHFGGHKVMMMTQTQWDSVWSIHQKLQGICVGHHNGEVCNKPNFPISYVCSNPECQTELISEGEIRGTPPKQLALYLNEQQTCPTCGNEDYLWGVYVCDNGGRSTLPSEEAELSQLTREERAQTKPEDADHWVERGTMFDKVLEITVVGQEKKFGKVMKTVKNFNIGTGADWSTVESDLSHFLEDAEKIQEMVKPWDLNDRYRPERGVKPDEYADRSEYVSAVLDSQAESLGKDYKNPFTEATGGGGFAKRGLRSFGATK